MSEVAIQNVDREALNRARLEVTRNILEYVRVASGDDLRRATWLISSALQSRLVAPNGEYYGRNWYSAHDRFIFVKPAAGQPLRQRDFCLTAKFIFIVAERLKLTTVDELFTAVVKI